MRKLITGLLRLLVFTFVLAGIGLAGWAGKEFWETKMSEDKATEEAKELLAKEPIEKKDFKPNFGSAAGLLVIDKIDAELPIVEGTEAEDLKKGVGHYKGSSYPLEEDQIMLSGHRDTVFRRMGELEKGDILTVRMPYGDFDYEIVNMKVVSKYDRTIIVPHDEETLTVSTCYPFRFIGDAPDRYIVDAKPVYDKSKYRHMLEIDQKEKKIEDENKEENRKETSK